MKSSSVVLPFNSSSAIISIILGNVEFSRHYLCLKCQKFEKIARKGKTTKEIGGNQETLASSQSTCKERCVEAGPCTMVTSLLFLLTLDIACTDQSLAVSRIAEH
jgi:hypothetical protein